ncbi:MAG TPA: ABC transporter substrate-binding protein [Symbiobacteriaceae bacterium]|nr:ABC transporter substrate-binding protein [Symbiobacteriaceae bacterium]
MKKILASVLSATMLLALAGCSTGSGSKNGQTIAVKLPSVSPLSGGQSTLGTAIANGVKLAIADKSEELKKLGVELKEFPQDDQAEPTQGTTIANRLISDKEVFAVIGTLNSGVAKTIAPVLMPEHVAMVSPANTGVSLTESGYTNYNRIVARDDFQGPAAARATKETLKAKSVYVLHDKTEYGQGLAGEYAKEAKKIGLDVKGEEGLNPKDTDFSALLTKVLQTSPDAIFYGGIYDTASLLFKQATDKGYKGAYLGGDGLDSKDIVDKSGEAANQVYYTSVADNFYGSAEGKKFFDKYKAKFNSNPDTYALYGYDAALVAIEGIAKWVKANPGKTPTRADIEKAIRETKDVKGMTGTISFDAKGDNPNAKVYLFQIKNKTYPGVSVAGYSK